MPATTPDYGAIARRLNEIFSDIGLEVTAEHRAWNEGLKDGIIFKCDCNGQILDRKELVTRIQDRAAFLEGAADVFARDPKNKQAQQVAKEARGAAAWLKSLEQLSFNDRTDYDFAWEPDNYDAAVISEETVTKAPFNRLLDNAKKMTGLQPINWDLNVEKKQGVAKALNNIARIEGEPHLQFAYDATSGKIIYGTDPKLPLNKKLSDTELDARVNALMRKVVATDSELMKKGQAAGVASQMVAHKSDRRYIALEKETGYDPAYLVDLIENAQIALAAKKYLNYAEVATSTNEGPLKERQLDKLVTTEDGRDKYSYRNNNLGKETIPSIVSRNGVFYHFDMEAEIPNLSNPLPADRKSVGKTNFVPAESEQSLVDTLNLMRGTMPIEMSADPEPVVVAPPAKKAPVKQKAKTEQKDGEQQKPQTGIPARKKELVIQ